MSKKKIIYYRYDYESTIFGLAIMFYTFVNMVKEFREPATFNPFVAIMNFLAFLGSIYLLMWFVVGGRKITKEVRIEDVMK